MSNDVAILGAGAIGAAIAHKLAERARAGDVTLIDAKRDVAAGKALDIMQSGPVTGFDTHVGAAGDLLDAAGASVIVIADAVESGEWTGDAALEMLRRLVRAGATAPLVFAGPGQLTLMETCARELQVPARRLIGTAPAAIAAAARALAGLELDLAAADVVTVGRPPAFVVAWSAASIGGGLLTDRVPAHRLLALSQSLQRLWPPGPLAIGAATAPIVEALLAGSRKLHCAATIVDGEFGTRGQAAMLPLALGQRRVLARVMPSLSPQERNSL